VLRYTYSASLVNLKHWTIEKAQKVSDSTGHVTSSGSYGVFFLLWSGRELNFRARSRYEPHEWLPYDYSSVMHYRAIAFSKDHLSATIVPKDRRAFFSIGQRLRFSAMDLAKLNVLYNCSTGYYRGGDVPSPVSQAGNDVAPGQDWLSESVMKKGTLSAKFENELFSESGIENDTLPPESGKGSSSGDFTAKPGPEKETSSPESEEDISSEDLFSKPGIQKGNFLLESEENIFPVGLFSKPKIKRETFIPNFGNNLSSEENFSTSGRDHVIR